MTKTFWRKDLEHLVPVDEDTGKWLGKQKAGAEFSVELKRVRSSRQLRLYWKLLEIAVGNQEVYASKEELSEAVKYATGHTKSVRIKYNGEWYERKAPLSISFENMTQDEFNEFFNKAVDYICTEVIPGTDPAALTGETERAVR